MAGYDPQAALEFARQVAGMYAEAEESLFEQIRKALLAGRGEPLAAGERFAQVRRLRAEAERIVRRLERLAGRAVGEAVNRSWQAGVDKALADVGRLGRGASIAQGQGAVLLAQRAAQVIGSVNQGMITAAEAIYQQVTAQAAAQVAAGAITSRAAVQRVLNHFADQGITGFTDASGRVWDPASYAEMAVRTATAQAAVDGHLSTLRDAGIDLVIVSRSPYTCPVCDPWEAAVLSQSGPAGTRTAPHAITGKPVTVHVAATVARARAEGLLHANCRHSLSAFLPGVTRPAPPVGKSAASYADTQRLRSLERQLRKWRRRASVAGDKTEAAKARKKIAEYRKAIAEHTAATGLRRRRERSTDRPDPSKVGGTDGGRPSGGHAAASTTSPPRPSGTGGGRGQVERLPNGRERVTASNLLPQQAADAINGARQLLPVEDLEWLTARTTLRQQRPRRVVDRLVDESRQRLAELRGREQTDAVRRRIATEERILAQNERVAGLSPEQVPTADLWMLEEERPAPQLAYRTDPNGRLLPPAVYEEYLDAVLAAGRAVAEAVDAALAGDARRRRLAERWRQVTDEAHIVISRYDELRASRSEDDPELARVSAVVEDYVRDLRKVRKKLAERDAELLRQVLSAAGRMGGEIDAEAVPDDRLAAEHVARPRADWRRVLDEAAKNIPTRWLNQAAERPLRIANDPESRATYYPDRNLLTLDDTVRAGYVGAFTSLGPQTALHELMHHMEQHVPGLVEMEYTFVRRRSTRDGVVEEARPLDELLPGLGYASYEVAYPDEWASPYTGLTREQPGVHDPAGLSWEVLSMGAEYVFGRDVRDKGDRELAEFVFGVMTVL